MTTTTSPKSTSGADKPAAAIDRLCALSEEARQLLQDGHRVLEFLHLLLEKQLVEDGVQLLAHALPSREAVWWACQCGRGVAVPPSSQGAAAWQAAETWAVDPSEAHRRAAYAAAAQAGFGTAAGSAALGAFLSGGSLGPPDLPAIPPDPLLTPQMVANAVLLAGVATEPIRAPERYAQFLTLGIQLAGGALKLPEKQRKT